MHPSTGEEGEEKGKIKQDQTNPPPPTINWVKDKFAWKPKLANFSLPYWDVTEDDTEK